MSESEHCGPCLFSSLRLAWATVEALGHPETNNRILSKKMKNNNKNKKFQLTWAVESSHGGLLLWKTLPCEPYMSKINLSWVSHCSWKL